MTGGVRRTARRRRAALVLLTTAAVVSCSRSGADPSADPTAASTAAPTAAPTADPPESTASSASPPSAGSSPTGAPPAIGPEDAVRTVVVSDQGPGTPTGAAPAWPDLLATRLGAAGIPMTAVTTAPEGAGFTSSPAFADLVARTAEGSTQLVVLFDSHLTGAGALTAAAEDTFAAVERAAPDALLVVVGPLTADGATAPGSVSAELAAATQHAGGTYVDPRAEGWSTDVPQPELAELLRPHLQPIVEVLAASGANR